MSLSTLLHGRRNVNVQKSTRRGKNLTPCHSQSRVQVGKDGHKTGAFEAGTVREWREGHQSLWHGFPACPHLE